MPWGEVQIIPGVNVQKTPTANTAGISQSQLIRFQEGLTQTMSGWVQLGNNLTIPSTVRDLHPWQDIFGNNRISAAATANLVVLSVAPASASFAITGYQDITPQTNTTNPAPNFSISSGSNLVTVVDAGSSASIFNSVYFDTPVAIGSFLLNGAYPINSVTGSSVYTIKLPSNSTSTVTSSGILPVFSTSSGSAAVTVTLPNNNFQAISGLFQQFIASTTVGTSLPLIVQGKYQIASVIDSTSFKINALTQASTTATATMNGGNAQLVYYVTIGQPTVGSGFGGGGFGSGGFGTGSGAAGSPGTPITTTDWTQDNWGGVLLSCPKDGPIYAWSPDSGFQTAQVITQAPFFNGGIFVSMPQQILVAWRSVQSSGVQDSLIIRWSNALDYTNWTVSNQTTAGSFHFSSGSVIVGAMQCPSYALVSTDVEVWTMSYVGGVVVFNFTKVGNACGWAGPHACGVLSGTPYWMGNFNFFTLGPNGAVPMPCSVWDQIFPVSGLGPKVRCAVNSDYSEVMWFYPFRTATENTNYVKVHIQGNEYEWDYGTLQRSAWVDISIVQRPLAADLGGAIYLHDLSSTLSGVSQPGFRTGWWTIGEGEEIPVVDFIIPDFIYGFPNTNTVTPITITFFGVDYPNDTPTTYGPYTVTAATQFINTRIRNRMISALIQSEATSGFWRLGRIRFRFAQSGRR